MLQDRVGWARRGYVGVDWLSNDGSLKYHVHVYPDE